jgi:hypothetical protein
MLQANQTFQKIRKSEAYPALLGALAGGIAGALLAALIARRAPAPRVAAEAERAPVSTPAPAIPSAGLRIPGGLSVNELVQLITIGTTLARQAQAWAQNNARGK